MKRSLQRLTALWMYAALLLFTLGIPIGAAAAERTQWSGTVNITSDTTIAEGVTLSGDTVLNISEGVVLTVQNSIGDYYENDKPHYSLTVNGPGKLIVNSGETLELEAAIVAGKIVLQNDVTVEATGLTVGIISEYSFTDPSIKGLTISGAKVTAKGATHGIITHSSVEIKNGADVEALAIESEKIKGFGVVMAGNLIISDSTFLCKGNYMGNGLTLGGFQGSGVSVDEPVDISIENSTVTAIGGESAGNGIGVAAFSFPVHMTIDKNSLVNLISGNDYRGEEGGEDRLVPHGAVMITEAEITIQGDSYLSLTGDSAAIYMLPFIGNVDPLPTPSNQKITLNSGSLFLGVSKPSLINFNHGSFTLDTKVAGHGWSDPEKAGTETALAADTYDGAALNAYKSAYFSDHTHHFTYSADGGVLTANCSLSCPIPEEELKVTLTAPEDLTNDGTAKVATISSGYSEEAFPEGISIVYYSGDTKLDGPPSDAGTYTARISQKGVTAMVEFTIPKPKDITPEDVPKTGDGASPLAWLLMVLSGLAVLTLIFSRRKAK